MAKKIHSFHFHKSDFSALFNKIYTKEKRIRWYIEFDSEITDLKNINNLKDNFNFIDYLGTAKNIRRKAEHYAKIYGKVTLIKVVKRGEWLFWFPKIVKR